MSAQWLIDRQAAALKHELAKVLAGGLWNEGLSSDEANAVALAVLVDAVAFGRRRLSRTERGALSRYRVERERHWRTES